MNRTRKIKITELNPHVICVLCGGYYINATTITECLHSFCRTCITRYLETSKYCPVCDVMVHKTRPLEYIRSDKTLQDLVYKLVPGLYKTEMKRRREYYSKYDTSRVPKAPSEDRGDEFYDRIIYTEDEKISLSLELCAEGIPFKTPSTIHGHSGPGNIKIKDVRYLQCPAAFSVSNIKKFIRMKFDLKQKYEIDVFHTAEPLLDYYTLMDIAYIYTWTRRAPLRLYYTVYEHRAKPSQPADVTQLQTNTTTDKSLAAKQPEQLVREKSNDSEKENQESNTLCAVKRKFPDGPGDISPDIEFEKTRPQFSDSRRKEGGPRKRAKKQVVYDSSVLEAMSESEEQLAKLTLGGEDGGKVNADDKSKSTAEDKGDNIVKRQGIDTNEGMVSDSVADEDGVKDTETIKTKVTGKCAEAEDRLGDIILSPFQPLNPSNDHKKESVYEFKSDIHDKSETNKTPSKTKKKKAADNSDKSKGKPKSDGSTEVSLVKSNKHPGIKPPKTSNTPKKKVAEKQEGDVSSPKKKVTEKQEGDVKKTAKKRGRPPLKKADVVSGDGEKVVEKVKRKYVRKADKKDKAKQEAGSQDGAKTAKDDKEDTAKPEKDESVVNDTKKNNEETVEACVNSGAKTGAEKTDTQSDLSDKDTGVKSNSETAENSEVTTCTQEMETQPVDSVREPTTPLYGQTPKAMEEKQGLPVSPNPDCAETNVITNGASCQVSSETKHATVKNVNNSNDLNKSAGGPVNYSVANSPGYISPGIKSLGIQSGVSISTPVSHVTLMGYPGYNGCDVSGNSNGFTRNMSGFNDGMLPLSPLSPSGVCVMGPYPRLSDPHCHNGQMINGYSGIEQNPDQPLDLTSNGHREGYMKGKIFKTKLLKKTYSKTDTGQVQKDKPPGAQNNNGLIPGQWI